MEEMWDGQSLEVVQLADGGFTIRRVGGVEVEADEDIFATQAEAEAALFERAGQVQAPGIMKPGFGQGLP